MCFKNDTDNLYILQLKIFLKYKLKKKFKGHLSLALKCIKQIIFFVNLNV